MKGERFILTVDGGVKVATSNSLAILYMSAQPQLDKGRPVYIRSNMAYSYSVKAQHDADGQITFTPSDDREPPTWTKRLLLMFRPL